MSPITVSNVVESVKCDALTVTNCVLTIKKKPVDTTRVLTIKRKPVDTTPSPFGPNGLTVNGECFMQLAVKSSRKNPTPPVTPAIKRTVLATKPESWTLKENVIHAPTQKEPQNLTLCVGNTGYELIVETHPYHKNCSMVFTRYVNGDNVSRKVMETCTEEMLIDVITKAEERIAKWDAFKSVLKSVPFFAENEGQYELILHGGMVVVQVCPSLFPTCECCMIFRRNAIDQNLKVADWECHSPEMFTHMLAKILQNPYEMSF